MTFDNLLSGMLYGPQGPETRRWKDDTWGPNLEKAMEGNDNENFIEKTRIVGKYSFGWATFFALSDVILMNTKGGLPNALSRMKFHYVPWMGGTVAYTGAVNASSSIRGGKSDGWNHVVGGFAAGSVVGKCAKCAFTGFFAGAGLAFLGWWYKDAAVRGYDMWPVGKLPPMHGNAWSHKADFTMVKWRLGDRPGYWCRTPEEVEKVYNQGQYGDGSTAVKHW